MGGDTAAGPVHVNRKKGVKTPSGSFLKRYHALKGVAIHGSADTWKPQYLKDITTQEKRLRSFLNLVLKICTCLKLPKKLNDEVLATQ